jgi:phosphoserine phosphatase
LRIVPPVQEPDQRDEPPVPPRFDGPTLRLTLAGADSPGLTSGLFEQLTRAGVTVLDVAQVVLGGQLVVGVLVSAPKDARAVTARLQAWGERHDVRLDIGLGHGDNKQRPAERAHVTVLAQPMQPATLAALAGRLADAGGNIDRIVRLSRWPVTAFELDVSGIAPDRLKAMLAADAARLGVDVAVQAAGLHRRAMRLVVLDVDSTLIRGEVIEMLAEHAGAGDDVAAVTAAAMAGELDFAGSLTARVSLLAGLPERVLDEVRGSIRLTPGARTLLRTLKRLGYRIGLVSGGFTQLVEPLAAELGAHFSRANTLEIKGGRLTGNLTGDIVDRAGKAAALRAFAGQQGVPLAYTVAIGDGANDLDMLAAAGLGVAFNAKPMVRAAADAAVNLPYLDSVLALLGIDRDEADEPDGPDDPSDPDNSADGPGRHAPVPTLAPAVVDRQPS